MRPNSDWGRPPESGRTQIGDDRPNPAEKNIKHYRNQSCGLILHVLGSEFVFCLSSRFLSLIHHFKPFTIQICVFRQDSGCRPQSEFGRIRAAVPNLSSAGFGRPSQIRVQPDSDGRVGSAGFGRTGGCGRIRAAGTRQCQSEALQVSFPTRDGTFPRKAGFITSPSHM